MPTLQLTLPRPYDMQRQVLLDARRFNVLACGRRWGKSTLGIDLVTRPMLEGFPVGWFAPTYKLLLEVWRWMEQVLRPVTRRSNATERRIELITGGVLEFWTLEDEDAGRSRKYKRVIVDEAGLVAALMDRWQSAIRPTLADMTGDGWFMGTPKGHNDFETLYKRGTNTEWSEWISWQRPTSDNPFIPASEVEAMRAELGPQYAAQEIDAEFIDGANIDRFLPSITLWDACKEDLPPLSPYEPMVLALDGAVSGDTFAVVGVTRHPTDDDRFAVRHVAAYEPRGVALLFDDIQSDIERLIDNFNIVQVCYDPYQLHQMAQHLSTRVWAEPFSQGTDRLIADRLLLDSTIGRQLAHDGHTLLRQHLDNADRKIEGGEDGKKLRIVKRTQSAKIDLAVCASMALYRMQEFQ